ncbi:hypothetical protein KIL84_004549 [Mauremys mutica]|uniref:Uncharacterized protein n=1 Tax=Mauremys mutica TaxID=74926 RepID=A0A9D4B046_9SAUR|nr:hypothetical protein KIL84_004549 [Mauremys mutica]
MALTPGTGSVTCQAGYTQAESSMGSSKTPSPPRVEGGEYQPCPLIPGAHQVPGVQSSSGGDTFTLTQESVLGDPTAQEAEDSHFSALGGDGRGQGAAVPHPRNGLKETWTQTMSPHAL